MKEHYGDIITKKEKNTLQIGFQNIGRVPIHKDKHKDDIIRPGISKLEFDIFGIAEVNVNWKYVPEDHRLANRSRHWRDQAILRLHITNMVIPECHPNTVA